MYTLEYAQFRNGRFQTWIEAGRFDTRAAAEKAAADTGLVAHGDDHLISFMHPNQLFDGEY